MPFWAGLTLVIGVAVWIGLVLAIGVVTIQDSRRLHRATRGKP